MLAATVALSFFAVGKIAAAYTLPKITIVILGLAVAAYRKDFYVSRRGLFLFAMLTASALLSVDPYLSVFGEWNDWSRGLGACAVYLLLSAQECPTTCVWYASAVLALLAVYQRLHGHPRAITTIGSPTDLGMLLAMAFPGAGYFTPLIGAGLWATGSRGAWLGAACGFTSRYNRRLAWALAIVGFAVSLRSHASKDLARVALWDSAAQAAIQHPLLGTGPDTFGLSFHAYRTTAFDANMNAVAVQVHAHNDIMQALTTTGILGLLAYLVFVWPLLTSPALFALFINAKFNLPSFEVLCAAALLARDYRQINLRWPTFALCLLALPWLAISWLAETSPFAQRLNPCEPRYAIESYNRGMIDRTALEHLVRCRPLHPEAHMAYAASLARLGDLRRARGEALTAAALDTQLPQIRQLRQSLAQ
jgi:hypothetical protein